MSNVIMREAWEVTLPQYIWQFRKFIKAHYSGNLDRETWKMVRSGLPMQWEREVFDLPRGAIVPPAVFRSFAKRVGFREACRTFRWAGNAGEICKLTPSLQKKG